MDAYFVASGLPLLVASFLTGAIEASVIPAFARLREQQSPQRATAVFSTVMNLFLLGAAGLTLIMFVFRRQLLVLTAPALDSLRMGLAVELAPFIFPVLLLLVTTGLLECILNTEGQFGWPAYAAVFVPLTTALLVVVVGARMGVLAIAIGTLAGVGLQLGVLIYRLRLTHISYRPMLDWHLPELGFVFAAASPALLGAMVNQASPLVDQIFASFLAPGSISALNYALKISGLPVGIIFATVGRAALPYLARQAASHDMQSFKATLRLYLWAVGLSTVLLSGIMLLLAHPLVRILFQRGAFTPEDTSHTAITMMGFAVGLAPMGMGFLLARAFSALGKNHLLMYVTIFSVIANAVFDYFMGRSWQSFGIALATSAVYCCTLIILLVLLRRAIGKLDLLTPPSELTRVIRRFATGARHLARLAVQAWRLPARRLMTWLRLPLMCTGAAALALATGVAVPHVDSQVALRVAVGMPLIVLMLRYHYALLIAWVLVGALVGSSLPLFQGRNIDTGLTIPTLLLLATTPLSQTTIPIATAFRRLPALAILFLYFLWVLTGIQNSPLGTVEFWKMWLLSVDYGVIAILAIGIISTRHRLLLLVDAMLTVGTFIALYGIVGYLTHQHGDFDRDTGTFRILSVFAAAPVLGLFLSLVIPLAIYRAFVARSHLIRHVALGVLLLLLAALALTFSRGALLSVLLSLVILAFFLPSWRLRIGLLGGGVALVLLALFLATLGNIPLLARFAGNDVSSVNGRTYLWQALLAHFDPWQLQGNGLGAATDTLSKLNLGTSGVVGNGLIATAPSNLYIGTLYDTGVIGVGLLISSLVVLGFCLIVGIKRTTGERRLLFAMALLMLINVLIQCNEVDDLWSQGIGLYFWVAVTLPFAACWCDLRPDNEELGSRAQHMPRPQPHSTPAQHSAPPHRWR